MVGRWGAVSSQQTLAMHVGHAATQPVCFGDPGVDFSLPLLLTCTLWGGRRGERDRERDTKRKRETESGKETQRSRKRERDIEIE